MLFAAALLAPTINVGRNPLSSLSNIGAMEHYTRCYALNAAKSSLKDVALDAIPRQSKIACEPMRSALMQGHEKDAERLKVLNAIDAYQTVTLPIMIKEVRERRKVFEPSPNSSEKYAPNQ